MTHIARYLQAHRKWCEREFPNVVKDGHYLSPKLPDTKTANGLTRFIIDFINWSGYRANRANVVGVRISKTTKTESGASFTDTYTRKTGNKGQADVDSTIKGRSCQFEVKIGRDAPRTDQIKRQIKERNAGGLYEFVHTPDEFLKIYDGIIDLTLF